MGSNVLTTLVVAAHPDDETLGAGIWMHRQAPDRVHVLHITDGSPQDMHDATLLGFPTRESYARARREEMSGVIQMLGIPPENWNQLEIPDKEAHLHTSQLLTQMAGIIDAIEPALVVTHAYEGGHPDHDTAAFAVALLRKTRRFQLLEFPLYRANEQGEMVIGKFLHPASLPQQVIDLTPQECNFKSALRSRFETQKAMLERFPDGQERFREPPDYDFAKAPHEGELLYERWGWPVSGSGWRECVRNASGFDG